MSTSYNCMATDVADIAATDRRNAADHADVRGRRVGLGALVVASLLVWAPFWVDFAIEGGTLLGQPYPVLVGVLLALNVLLTCWSLRYKRLLVATAQRRLVNPLVRWSLRLRLPLGWALLETTGRRSGRTRSTPVGDGRLGDTFWLVAEHGADAAYVKNLTAHPDVRVLVRSSGLRMGWRVGTATVRPDLDPLEVQRLVGGWRLPLRTLNALLVRVLGTRLLVIRIDLDPPTGS